MRQIGLVEVGRTGVVGLIRGKEPNWTEYPLSFRGEEARLGGFVA